jgi:hypothetical protein
MKKLLKEYSKNVYSQTGEDGIIQEILIRIESKFGLDKWCVEFGAWDGVHLSNTCRLIREEDYRAVLIEANPRKIKDLCRNFPSNKVIKICSYVEFEGENSLDSILRKTDIPPNFDFLSIDIDGNDIHIFDSIQFYRPKIVSIEYNPTIPVEVDFFQKYDPRLSHGSSCLSIVKLAEAKGYMVAAITDLNVILVDQTYKDVVLLNSESFPILAPEIDKVYIFTGYDGSVLSNSAELSFPWHRMKIKISDINILPGILRNYPLNFNIFQRVIYGFFLAYQSRSSLFTILIEKYSVCKFILSRDLRSIRDAIFYCLVRKRAEAMPDFHKVKIERIRNFQRKWDYDNFIETGTFYGQMIKAVHGSFKKIYSIEFSPKYFRYNQLVFKKDSDIQIIEGDSSIVLRELLLISKFKSALFWLDGHYSGGDTGLSDKVSPIIEELQAILSTDLKKFCIVIDDWRLFDGLGYPSKEVILELVCNLKGDSISIFVDSDALVINSN